MSQTRSNDGTKILVISDLHVGSKFAVAPRKLGNKITRAIYREWKKMTETGPYDYLILNGEAVDGPQVANKGKEVWEGDVSRQIDIAIDLVNEIDYEKLLVTYGTTYHTQENLNADEQFAKQIGANAHGWELNFQPLGTNGIFHISHQVGVSSSSWQYRTTPIAKELVAALLNEKELYKYDGIIRSHAHYFVFVRFTAFGIITPCWQTRTPYMIKKGLSLIPKMGYVVLQHRNEREWSIRAKTFKIPRPELVVI